MGESLPRSHGLSRLFAVLAMAAMLVRALAAPGYMFAPNAEGSATIVLCSEHGPVSVPAPGRHPTHDTKRADGHCLFAASAHLGNAPSSAAILAPIAIAIRAEPSVRPTNVHTPMSAPPPPARGPPLNV